MRARWASYHHRVQ